jgi:hypothetical protein
MSEAGRRRWARAAVVAVFGTGGILVGWAGLSRSAPPDPVPVPALGDAAQAVPTAAAGPVAPASLPAPPAQTPPGRELPPLPTIPPLPPGGVVPASLPAVPEVPAIPAAPALPVIPAAAPAKPGIDPVAPAVPVLLPPSIDGGVTPAAEPAPPPSPAKSARPAAPAVPDMAGSRLQDVHSGNSVKPEKSGKSPAAPVLPVAPLAVPPVTTPGVPALPAVGAPRETPGTPVDRTIPAPDAGPNLTEPPPGDPTVRALNQSVAAAVIGGMFLAPAVPAPAAQFKVPLPVQIDEKTDKALADIQKDLKELTELLKGARDTEGFPIPTKPGLLDQLKELNNRLAQVEEDLKKLKGQTSLRPGGTGSVPATPPDPRAGKGTIRVVNEYPVQVSIVVNGTSYRVAPTKTLDVDVPAGEFTYQLLESGGASTRSVIKEKETVTLRIK